MQFPLDLSFSLMTTAAATVNVRDAAGQPVAHVRQKRFRLKEDVEVFSDQSRATPLWRIKADRIIDWSAAYRITDPAGASIGTIRRRGGRSLWRATYEVTDGQDHIVGGIREEDPWVKVLDGLVSLIPMAELVTGFFLNPAYVVSLRDSNVLRVRKRRSFLEAHFTIDQLAPLDGRSEALLVASVLMMVLLERGRG